MADSKHSLVFQNDHSILLMTQSASFEEVRDRVRPFAELQQAAGPYHVYRLTDVSLWSAAAAGITADDVMTCLNEFGQNLPPSSLTAYIQQVMGRYGVMRLEGSGEELRLESSDRALLSTLGMELGLTRSTDILIVPASQRGWVKAQLARRGYPIVDEAFRSVSPAFGFELKPEIELRPYQSAAVTRFVQHRSAGGVVLLPCGAGKTVIGVAVAAKLNARTLVVTPSRTIGDQWREHFLSMTSASADSIAMYRRGTTPPPISIATYQALTARGSAGESGLADILDHPWGLIIYDEVHSLPADVFRQSAAVQSVRRLGLTATLIREDGREREVFSLVGPTIYSAPWRELERHGWIAPVDCIEIRINISQRRKLTEDRLLAAKVSVARRILRRHPGESTLIVANRLKEVAAVSRAVDAPVVTGQTPLSTRTALYDEFRSGRISTLALSRVANVGVDLPDASVLVQISGAFGSRQEEAQRVGRVLRPKPGNRRAIFYTLVIAGTREVEFAARRQRFLVDQGYRYRVVDVDLDRS